MSVVCTQISLQTNSRRRGTDLLFTGQALFDLRKMFPVFEISPGVAYPRPWGHFTLMQSPRTHIWCTWIRFLAVYCTFRIEIYFSSTWRAVNLQMKMLQTKLEGLIATMKNRSPPLPGSPTKLKYFRYLA